MIFFELIGIATVVVFCYRLVKMIVKKREEVPYHLRHK